MLPIDPKQSFRLLPTAARKILEASHFVQTLAPFQEDGREVRISIFTHPRLGRLRFREAADPVRGVVRVSIEWADSFVLRANEPLNLSQISSADSQVKITALDGVPNAYAFSVRTGGLQLMGMESVSFPPLWNAQFPGGRLSLILQQITGQFVTASNEVLGFLPTHTGTPVTDVFPQWAWQPVDGGLFTSGAGFSDQLLNASRGGAGVPVAILDTGICASHESFTAASPANNNAGISLVLSRDFTQQGIASSSSNVTDLDGHGTHCASVLIGRNARKNFRGICPDASLIVCRVIQNGAVSEIGACNAAIWAIAQGARIISMSWILTGESQLLGKLMHDNPNTLFVTAPDNRNEDISVNQKFPCCYRNTNLISVIGASRAGGLGPSSDYDSSWNGYAHVAAPGEGICVCNNDGNYASSSGTSIAVPHVAGLAAMLFQINPDARAEEVRDLILDSAFRVPQLAKDCLTKGRLNAQGAWDKALQKWNFTPFARSLRSQAQKTRPDSATR